MRPISITWVSTVAVSTSIEDNITPNNPGLVRFYIATPNTLEPPLPTTTETYTEAEMDTEKETEIRKDA